MKRLLIATTNPGKFTEAAEVFSGDGIEILSLKDFPEIKEVPETGKTFEGNASLKAKGYFSQSGVPVIADDGGLIIDFLGGLPGVDSHRWLGYEASDEDRARAVIEKMKDVPPEKRTARLGGFAVFYDGKNILKSENWLEGVVAEDILGEVKLGLPYRSILFLPKFNKLYSDLTPAEHNEASFRRRNLLSLKPKIFAYLEER